LKNKALGEVPKAAQSVKITLLELIEDTKIQLNYSRVAIRLGIILD
jgi:hypothetical protein